MQKWRGNIIFKSWKKNKGLLPDSMSSNLLYKPEVFLHKEEQVAMTTHIASILSRSKNPTVKHSETRNPTKVVLLKYNNSKDNAPSTESLWSAISFTTSFRNQQRDLQNAWGPQASQQIELNEKVALRDQNPQTHKWINTLKKNRDSRQSWTRCRTDTLVW